MEDRKVIWSSGGGVQSTAIAVLIRRGLLPRPDRAVIADTGRETQETWDYLERYTNPMLAEIGFTVERIPRQGKPSLFNNEGTILIPVFATGNVKFSNFCSSYWKREIVKRWANDNSLTPAINWVGISMDEKERIRSGRALNWQLGYPLITIFPLTRFGCTALIADQGLPPAPKSSCYICPNRRRNQWKHLRDNYPGEWAKACEEDIRIRTVKPDVFLHESLIPLDKVDLDSEEQESPQEILGCSSGDCFV
jgi:hypothetical protein